MCCLDLWLPAADALPNSLRVFLLVAGKKGVACSVRGRLDVWISGRHRCSFFRVSRRHSKFAEHMHACSLSNRNRFATFKYCLRSYIKMFLFFFNLLYYYTHTIAFFNIIFFMKSRKKQIFDIEKWNTQMVFMLLGHHLYPFDHNLIAGQR